MRLSSCVCRDEATEVIRAIANFDLGDSRDKCSTWHETVVRPALRLDKRLRVLSAGWGDGFAGMALFFWLWSLGFFCFAINRTHCDGLDTSREVPRGTSQFVYLVETAVALALPLVLALDVASTSSQCNHVRGALNDARIRILDNENLDLNAVAPVDFAHKEITELETALGNVHRRQGLGFTVFGVVVDRHCLKVLGAKLSSGFWTIVTFLFAIRDNELSPTDQCDAISALCDDMLPTLGENATCGCVSGVR